MPLAKLDSNKLTLLHSIRGFAAVYVAICHSKWAFWVGGTEYLSKIPRNLWGIKEYFAFAIDMSSSNGTSMVVVFYVLSGFFIAYTFEKNKWKLGEFYFSRFLRIYIPYIASLVVAFIALWGTHKVFPEVFKDPFISDFNFTIVRSYENLNLKCLFRSLFFLRYNGYYFAANFVYWSLLLEALFYIIAPFVTRKPTLFIIGAAAIYFPALFFIPNVVMENYNIFFRFIFKYSFFFALGIYIFNWLNKHPDSKKPPVIVIVALSLLLLGGTVLGGLIEKIHYHSFALAAFWSAVMIYIFVKYDVPSIFPVKIFKFLGKISYSLYLVHFPVYIFIYGCLSHFTGKFRFYHRWYWGAIPCAIIFSYIFYELVEKRSVNLISKWRKKILDRKVISK